MTAPHGIDLEQYRTQARELLKLARAADSEALDRIRRHHPEHEALVAAGRIQLADAQLVIAREQEYASWPRLKDDLLYRSAVRAIGAGDVPRLEALLEQYPRLIRRRSRRGEWYDRGYFQGAMLLHHVAGNPNCFPIPPNVLDVTRVLLARGADPNARTDAGGSTIGLLLTSRPASEANIAWPLIDLLREAGAADNGSDASALDASLLNVAPATAAERVRRGARMELRHAAGLGRLDALERMLAAGVTPSQLEEALAFASIRGQESAARMLVCAGAKGDVLVTPGGRTPRTALHEAANRGHRSIVMLLVENGADASVVEPHWGGTPAGWARHGEPPHLDLAAVLDQRAVVG